LFELTDLPRASHVTLVACIPDNAASISEGAAACPSSKRRELCRDALSDGFGR
jgi:hypothetical protein